MTEILAFIQSLDLPDIEVVAIVVGLFFTALAYRLDARSRQVENLRGVTEGYRKLWSELNRRPKLVRVLAIRPDLENHPITPQEDRFVRALIHHLYFVYRASKVGLLLKPEHIRKDIRQFFMRPIPRQVWNEIRDLQDTDFLRFVESTFEKSRAMPPKGRRLVYRKWASVINWGQYERSRPSISKGA